MSLNIEHTGIDPTLPLNKLILDKWTTTDGLVSNNLISVFQSSDGFLWISSYNGLMRFDGHQFELYDKNKLPDVFMSSTVYRSYEDNNGNLWFPSQGSYIIKYTQGTFETITGENLTRSVRCLLIEDDSTLWVGTNNNGLLKGKSGHFQNVKHESLEELNINDLAKDLAGNIWVATDGYGVVKIDKNGQITASGRQDGLSGNVVNALMVHKDGRVFIGTNNGLTVYQNGQFDNVNFYINIPINYILEGNYGEIWLGTELGLYRTSKDLKLTETFSQDDGFESKQISFLCLDHEGSLWFTTKKSGLHRLKQGQFINYSVFDGLSTNFANIVVEHNNRYFIGLDDGKISIVENGIVSPFVTSLDFQSIGIRDILFDKKETMWIASYKGLLKKQGKSERLFTADDGLSSEEIRKLFLDDDGSLWMATKSGGIIIFKNDKVDKIITRNDGLGSNYIFCIEEDRHGNKVVGTYGGGMSVITPAGIVNTYKFEDDSSGYLIFNIDIDSENVYWLSTNVGIYKFANESFQKVRFQKESNTETFFDIIHDDSGRAWMTTNRGIVLVNKAELNQHIQGKVDSLSIVKLLDNHDGMLNRECTGAVPSLKASDGSIWFPTLGGVAVVRPREVSFNQLAPQVIITDVAIDGQISSLINKQKLIIPSNKIRYAFNFSALSYLAPAKNKFRYKMEGFDKHWTDAANRRQAIYANLPPGKYEFKVMASNNDNIWNEDGASIKLVVKPAFYQTWLFKLLLFTLFILLVRIIYNWRVQKVKKRNRELKKLNNELDRFVYSASHDLRAPLASIQGLVEIAHKEKTLNGKDECLKLIDVSIKKLDRFTREIIDYSRNARAEIDIQEIDFKTLIDSTFQELKFLEKASLIDMRYSIEENGILYSDYRRIGVILNNLVSNAIIYHNFYQKEPFIDVRVSVGQKNTSIIVEDNGSGIKEEHLQKIFKMFYRATQGSSGSGLGLYIVQEALNKLKGQIKVKSVYGHGTVFEIDLPVLKPRQTNTQPVRELTT
ncbi:MAG: GHKL domain-containing protein [Cyclobacteriaceae bacterium]|nr:GHKL domain-containing protein [Cyclobacteriaceae bacterium]